MSFDFALALDVFLVVVFVVSGSGLAMAEADLLHLSAVLIRPLLRGKRREIINFNLTNLSILVGTLNFEVQHRYFSLVQ